MYENDGWNALYLENHDQPRSINRFASGSPEYRAQSSKMLATFLGCQAGTLFVYQGQELGMANVPKGWGINEYKDLNTLNHWSYVNPNVILSLLIVLGFSIPKPTTQQTSQKQ